MIAGPRVVAVQTFTVCTHMSWCGAVQYSAQLHVYTPKCIHVINAPVKGERNLYGYYHHTVMQFEAISTKYPEYI